jgi:hypothetical protein
VQRHQAGEGMGIPSATPVQQDQVGGASGGVACRFQGDLTNTHPQPSVTIQ